MNSNDDSGGPATLAELHCEAQDLALSYIEQIGDDQWGASTPCSEWNVRALVNHITAGNLWVAALAAGETADDVGTSLDGDLLGDDPVGSFRASMETACRAFDEPGAMERIFPLSFGDVPGSLYVSQRFVDVLIHAWDVAEATGQAADLDNGLVHRCYDVVEPWRDAIRESDAFGAEVPVEDDAATQVQLLALLGRRA